MSAILAAPLVGIAVLATIGQPHSTKLAKFTKPARLKAADGGVADGIGPADVHQGLTGFPARNGFPPLVVRQFRLAAHYYPASFGALPAFAGATSDQFSLELGEAAQDRQHQPAVRCGRVGPGIPQ